MNGIALAESRHVRKRPLSEHRPSVTGIVAFSNDAEYVGDAIARLRALTYPQLELILVDDGSTDATAQLLANELSSLPAARLISNATNLGVAASRNRAMAEATGEYLWFADCDDRWEPGIIDALVAGLADPAGRTNDIVVGGAEVESADGVVERTIDVTGRAVALDREHALAAVLLGEISGYLWTKLFRRAIVGQFPVQRSLSDLPFVAAAVASSTSVARIPSRLYTYVQRPGSITSSHPVDLDDLARSTASVLLTAKDAPPDLTATFRYWSAVLPAHTQWALRRERARAELAGVDVQVRWRDIRLVFAHDRRTALKALWIWAAGPLFAPSYRLLAGRRHG